MTIDLLSELLRPIRVRGAVFCQLEFGRAWGIRTALTPMLATKLIPGADHILQCHLVSHGHALLRIEGYPSVHLSCGDLLIIPHGDPYALSSAPDSELIDFDPSWVPAATPQMQQRGKTTRRSAEGRPANGVTLGFFGYSQRHGSSLIAVLPRYLHLPATAADACMPGIFRKAMEVARHALPGKLAVLDRMSEMVLVEALRCHIDYRPAEHAAWLTETRDRQIGQALAMLHEEPARAWTIEMLARTVALSRSAFCKRFLRAVGYSPIHYLAVQRIEAATRMLLTTELPISAIALAVGYASESAFSRAFRRLRNTPPARWRRTHTA